jgi:hypothetical protein
VVFTTPHAPTVGPAAARGQGPGATVRVRTVAAEEADSTALGPATGSAVKLDDEATEANLLDKWFIAPLPSHDLS